MIGSYRIVVRIFQSFPGVLLMALGCLSIAPADASIVLTGDVIPSPAVGDPWDVGGALAVGETAIGTMTVDAGSNVSNTDGFVANLAGSTGTVTVNGFGSAWNNSGELRMGNFGNGTLNITGGGSVSVGGNGRIGNEEGGVGTATVDGPGSNLISAELILVGRAGSGTLNIQNSGTVSDGTGGIAIFEDSSGTVTIYGLGSAWHNSAELQVADGGNASLNILNGGEATSPIGFIALAADGIGTVTVNGAGSTWTLSDQLQVGYGGNGTLNIQNDGTVLSSLGYVGVLAAGTGTVTVTGAGSTWANSGELQVGYEGNGTLNIQSGAEVSSGAGIVGVNAGSNGTVTVDGAGSTWSNNGSLTVGNLGTGSIHINNGGQVRAAVLEGVGGVNFNGGSLRITASDAASNTFVLNTGGGTLDASSPDTTVTVTSNIGGTGGLTKAGPGTLELTGANTYNGDTRVDEGVLNLSQEFLSDLADVYLELGAALGLNYSGADVIDSLFINGSAGSVGTYGAIDSGADFELAIFSGPGLLEVSRVGLLGDYNDNGTVDAADYTVWRNRLHSATSLRNDDTPGVGHDDYTRWTANYGQTAGSGSVANLNVAVPEPVSLVLFVAGVLTICACWRANGAQILLS